MKEVPKDVFDKEKRFSQRMNEEEQRRFHDFKQKVRMANNKSGAVNKAVEIALKFLKLKGDVIADIQHKTKYYEIFPSDLEEGK